jgi:phosphoribosylformylglycinamidine cyclo-ligase
VHGARFDEAMATPTDLSGLSRGDSASSRLFDACQRSIEARAGQFGAPAVLAHQGLHHIVATDLGPHRLLLNSDGIGTKVEVAERLGRYDTLAFDLIAMLADDAVRFGAQPLSLSNVLDIHRAEAAVIDALARGLERAARVAQIAVVGGEVAELGARISGRGASGGLHWAGTLLSILVRGRELTGATVAPGDTIVALRERGLRCNGFTLARAAAQRMCGDDWHGAASPSGGTLGDVMLEPSTIYAPAVLDGLGRVNEAPRARASAIAHVTGGGIPGKLGRVLGARGLGATLDDLFEPPPFVAMLQRAGEVSDEDAYRAWCMGQGMLVVTTDAGPWLEICSARGIDARVAGRVHEARAIELRSRGAFSNGALLHFPVAGEVAA